MNIILSNFQPELQKEIVSFLRGIEEFRNEKDCRLISLTMQSINYSEITPIQNGCNFNLLYCESPKRDANILLQLSKKLFPFSKHVLFSPSSETEDLLAAFTYESNDYILQSEYQSTLRKCILRLAHEAAQHIDVDKNRYDFLMHSYTALQKEKLLRSLLGMDMIPLSSNISLMSEFHLKANGLFYLCILSMDVTIDYLANPCREYDMLLHMNILTQCIEEGLSLFENTYQHIVTAINNEIFVLFYQLQADYAEPQQESFYNNYKLFVEDVSRQMRVQSHNTVSAGISNAFYDINNLNIARQQAALALQRRYYEGLNASYPFVKPTAIELENEQEWNIDSIMQELYKASSAFSQNIISRLAKELCDILEKNKADPETVSQYVLNFIYSMTVNLVQQRKFESVYESITLFIQDISSLSSFEDVRSLLYYYLSFLMKIVSNNSTECNDTIETIKEYIHEHYMLDISLKEIAAAHYLNPNYLSDLFRKKTSITFSDYLIEVRILAAKKLLKNTSEQISVIAEQVGYSEVSSFNRIFKRRIGLSASQYRHDHLNSDENSD